MEQEREIEQENWLVPRKIAFFIILGLVITFISTILYFFSTEQYPHYEEDYELIRWSRLLRSTGLFITTLGFLWGGLLAKMVNKYVRIALILAGALTISMGFIYYY